MRSRRASRRWCRARSARWRAARPPAGTAAAPASSIHAPSSRYFPSRSSVLVVLELDTHRLELVADTVGVFEILRLAGGVARVDERVHLIRIDDTAVRMIFKRFAFREREYS